MARPFGAGHFVLLMDTERRGDEHWTYTLFVEHADVYLPFLEKASARAEAETAVLIDIFQRLGVPDRGRVLDVACGTGRHAIPLAQAGYRVTGVDLSPLYVRMAREEASRVGADVTIVCGDLFRPESLVDVAPPFHAVINMFTSHGYQGRANDLEMFARLRGLSGSGAVLVVLTSNRDWIVNNFEPEGLDLAGRMRVLQRRFLRGDGSVLAGDWSFFEGRGESLKLKLRLEVEHQLYVLDDLRGLLEQAGWSYVESYGSDRSEEFELLELTADSKTMWIVARA